MICKKGKRKFWGMTHPNRTKGQHSCEDRQYINEPLNHNGDKRNTKRGAKLKIPWHQECQNNNKVYLRWSGNSNLSHKNNN